MAKYPALCSACLELVGDDIAPGCPVVCTTANDCGGMVDRLEDDGQMVVVRTCDGGEAWLPIQEVVRVQPPF
jgi:hypothetical protein